MPTGARTIVGALLMVGGLFGFLPVLGFWMLPLGVAFVALDVPWTRHHIHSWMDDLREVAYHVPPVEESAGEPVAVPKKRADSDS